MNNIIELGVSLFLLILGIILFFYISSWNLTTAKQKLKSFQADVIWVLLIPFIGIIFSAFLLPSLLLKYRNHSNIEAYIRKIKIPADLMNIEE